MGGELWQLELSLDATTIEGKNIITFGGVQTHSLMNEKEKV
jgi:hypothetical protein